MISIAHSFSGELVGRGIAWQSPQKALILGPTRSMKATSLAEIPLESFADTETEVACEDESSEFFEQPPQIAINNTTEQTYRTLGPERVGQVWFGETAFMIKIVLCEQFSGCNIGYNRRRR
ncbi:MAG: hypothetical protein KDB00_12615, partial [Planctomycetales bacterium]|nr:hypothetical protein [Planctomycetales bacterium]